MFIFHFAELQPHNLYKKMHFLIAGVAVVSRFELGSSFTEFIALMEKRGFHACDVLDIAREIVPGLFSSTLCSEEPDAEVIPTRLDC